MQGNCSIAMLPTQLLAALIVAIAVLGSSGYRAFGSDVKDTRRYPWEKQSSSHEKPLRVSEDI